MSWLSDRVGELSIDLVPVASPEDPVGWGSDLWCEDDLAESFEELGGDDSRVVAQAAYRAITTPRGTVPDAKDYGIDIRAYIHAGLTTRSLQQIEGTVALEIAKDDRIASVDVTATLDESAIPLTVRLRIDAVIASSGDRFSLVVGLTDADAVLEEMVAR